MEMQPYLRQNGGTRYLLTILDALPKYALVCSDRAQDPARVGPNL